MSSSTVTSAGKSVLNDCASKSSVSSSSNSSNIETSSADCATPIQPPTTTTTTKVSKDNSNREKTKSSNVNKPATPKNDNNSDANKSKEDEICDDWEQLDQQKIEKSLQSIKINSKNNSNNSNNERFNDADEEKTSFKNTNSNPVTQPFMNINNQFPQPSIKILKRPASNKKLTDLPNQSQNSNAPTQPIKTFEQREQEYAQARLRIMGSAHPEEDIAQTISNVNTTTTTPANNNNNNNYSGITNSISYQNFNHTNNSSMNSHSNSQPNRLNLIRDPVAPDPTSKGFKNNYNYNNKNYNNNNNNK